MQRPPTKADALLAFPRADNPVVYHKRLGRELPVIAFYLYREAGGVDYDDATLHRILELPEVIGIKVATLDSVMTFQRIAAVLRPASTKAIYFVADGTGGHVFAETLQQHQANVAKWYALRRQRGEM